MSYFLIFRQLSSFPSRRSSDLLPSADIPVISVAVSQFGAAPAELESQVTRTIEDGDRKSTRLNSSHSQNSYAVFCLKKKKSNSPHPTRQLFTESLVDGERSHSKSFSSCAIICRIFSFSASYPLSLHDALPISCRARIFR